MSSSQHGLLLKRFLLEDSNGLNGPCNHYLSALSTDEERVLFEDLKVPSFLKNHHHYVGNSCGGIIWFDNYSCDDEIVVWNPTTSEIRTLSPAHESGQTVRVWFSGLGYDSISGDYKFVRIVSPPQFKIDGPVHTTRAELYSFNRDSWKEISNLTKLHVNLWDSAYVDGSYYWLAFGDGYMNMILSFDFANETFSSLPLPGSPFYYRTRVVNFDGSLGVLRFPWVHERTTTLSIVLWVLNVESSLWTRVFDVSLDGVTRPLGFGGNACRLLFCEGKPGTQLLVYDRITQELKEVGNYDMAMNFEMEIFSYVETTNPPPQAKHSAT